MLLTVLGCAGSYPTPESPASGYLLEHAGTRIVLDMGNGTLGALQRFCPLDGVAAVVLSHLHVDHCVDLASYAVARRYGPLGPLPPIPVFGPAGVADRMADIYGVEHDPGLRASFEFAGFAADGGEVADIGPFRISSVPVAHPVVAHAVRVEADGAVLVFSGDTGPTPALTDVARGADLALFEATYDDDAADLPPDLHLTARQAGEHASAAGAARLLLTHLGPDVDPRLALGHAAAAFGGPVELARPGGRHRIGPGGAG